MAVAVVENIFLFPRDQCYLLNHTIVNNTIMNSNLIYQANDLLSVA